MGIDHEMMLGLCQKTSRQIVTTVPLKVEDRPISVEGTLLCVIKCGWFENPPEKPTGCPTGGKTPEEGQSEEP